MSSWYGADPVWWVPLEAAARRRFQGDLSHHYLGDRLIYTVNALAAPGDPPLVTATITFWARPRYPTYGRRPCDTPQVHADADAASPHRNGDRSLCLWFPLDPPERRWTSEKGLLDLIEIVRRHLALERVWRLTGGTDGGVWMLPDAPHGFPEVA